MKIHIHKTEYWPVYERADTDEEYYSPEVEIDEDLWTKYMAAKDALDGLLSDVEEAIRAYRFSPKQQVPPTVVPAKTGRTYVRPDIFNIGG
jgi:hypothetical protein